MSNKKTILIAEDEKSLSKALTDKFSSENFDVVSVSNGKECLEVLENQKPDFLILDLVMPEMDGLELLDKISSNEDMKNLPVLVLTNLSDMDKISQVIEKGVHDYLVKSDNSLDSIVEKVKERLKD